jgi:hypothetical protein
MYFRILSTTPVRMHQKILHSSSLEDSALVDNSVARSKFLVHDNIHYAVTKSTKGTDEKMRLPSQFNGTKLGCAWSSVPAAPSSVIIGPTPVSRRSSSVAVQTSYRSQASKRLPSNSPLPVDPAPCLPATSS